MKKEGKIKVLFHHGDFPDDFESHDYFGSGGFLHKYLENRVGREIKWHFVGGYINNNHHKFWILIKTTDVLFIRAQNMNNGDINMFWNHAEESMLKVVSEIKRLFPDMKIFFYEYPPDNSEEFEKYGTIVTDLHGDDDMLNYFDNI